MSLGQDLAPHLPFLRRYARALTGSQAHGDAFVRATLEAIVAAPDDFPRDVDPRLGLYRTFHAIWSSANIEEDPGNTGSESGSIARRASPASLRFRARRCCLTAMEGFTPRGYRLSDWRRTERSRELVKRGAGEIERQTRGRSSDHRG
jgi:hypothetical protein